MKKALIVTSVASMIEQFILPSIKTLQELNYEVTVATNFKKPGNIPLKQSFKTMNDLINNGVRVYNIPFHRSPFNTKNIIAYKKLKKIIDSSRYNIIHCHSPIGGALTRWAARGGRRNGTKIIYTAHGFHFYNGANLKNWLLFYPVERILSKFTDVLITINKEDFRRAKSFEADEVKYIPGVGIDLEEINKISPNKYLLHKELNLSKEDLVILSVGELNNNKNHEIIIRALAKLNNPKIHYVICGTGENEERLKKISNKMDLSQQIHLLGYRRDVLSLYKAADMFVFPSLREGLSVSLMEAMASGLPVIASDIRGNQDLIDNNKGGYLVKVDDLEDYANRILFLSTKEEKRRDFSNYNFKKIKGFSLEKVQNKMREIYLS